MNSNAGSTEHVSFGAEPLIHISFCLISPYWQGF
jgi:hypothetical protein